LGYSIDPQFERKEAVRLLRLTLSIDDDDSETLAQAAVVWSFMIGDHEKRDRDGGPGGRPQPELS
jgi:adenylate cyclase